MRSKLLSALCAMAVAGCAADPASLGGLGLGDPPSAAPQQDTSPTASGPANTAPADCDTWVAAGWWGRDRLAFKIDDDSTADLFTDPVSIVPLDQASYLIANYWRVFHFNARSGELKLLGHDWPARYNPTDLAFDPVRQRLFIANSEAHDILIAQYDPAADALHITGEITRDDMLDPEGVSLSADGGLLAVGSFTSGTVHLFDVQDAPLLKWRHDGGIMHGVKIIDDVVYALDLEHRVLEELDLATGEVRRRAGSIGFGDGGLQFIWPTSVDANATDLLISDGLRGTVFVLDRADLSIRTMSGFNGPTHQFPLLPYKAIYDTDGSILVTSTGEDRILKGAYCGGRIAFERSYTRRENDWEYVRGNEEFLNNLPFIGNGWNWPAWVTGPTVTIANATYNCGFRVLTRVDGSPGPDSIYLSKTRSLFAEDYLFTTMIPGGDNCLFINSADPRQLYYVIQDGIPYLVPLALARGCWALGDVIYGPQQSWDSADLRAMLNDHIATLRAERLPNGLLQTGTLQDIMMKHPLSVQPLVERYRGPLTPEQFVETLRLSFDSPAGQAFLDQYLAWDASTDPASIQAAAQTYFSAQSTATVLWLDEFTLVSTLTAVPFPGF